MASRALAFALLASSVSAKKPKASEEVRCEVDSSILNSGNFATVTVDIGGNLLAPLCGKNRGVMVVQGEGGQYGCAKFPPSWGVKDANDIMALYAVGNLTASQALGLYGMFVEAVYETTPLKSNDAHACDANGLLTLTGASCGDDQERPFSAQLLGEPIRAATAAGLFDGVEYTYTDFQDMARVGLNSVQLPVPVSALGGSALLDAAVENAVAAGLAIVLQVQGAVDATDAQAAVDYASKASSLGATVLLIDADVGSLSTLPTPTAPTVWMQNLATAASIEQFEATDGRYASIPFTHTANMVDVASSTASEDRAKMVYHEAITCGNAAFLRFAQCRKGTDVFVGDVTLAIDNCASAASSTSTSDLPIFGDQCDRMQDRDGSPWWKAHAKSFSARQLETYERGLGWAWAWKLSSAAEKALPPRALQEVSLRAALKAKLVTLGSEKNVCLFAPPQDWALGDSTLAPTPAPIPPTMPPTPPPAPSPTCASEEHLRMPSLVVEKDCSRTRAMVEDGTAGALIMLAVLAFAYTVLSQRTPPRAGAGYSAVQA
ncbi:hypothetical protein M885DRAFT_618389 [Pelagophyceae sp. CCMP2097]|nr:hypothetical protein M885DRAFT_618389 [Pelagophyceae sp. CCMP2097]|mmetsp:Transcript_13690/g.45666  ORF Transcript_13690/g.45666 Transcript_13690/m.45666 type:complete len:547 (-) Transcript_13690:52-1692(-)|eukprot:CAMPEP_0184092326 /NCGR_PEP_ID=MMETSP0974-20121125/8191_1 /TAXON_ID=483370 /ORGANISM="non described non described, Strain CCMP2097" /LENGTH=546 /DNA_ID=CAMNT_0026395083 /DNA_START=31 /DNA_END=1671 /DNA_ORIENTATION=-